MTPSEAPQEPAPADSGDLRKRQRRMMALMAPVVMAFVVLTAGAVVAAYRFGEDVVFIGERTISDFSVWEVTGGAALGVLGAFVGLGAAAISAVAALVVAIVGSAVAVFGVALGAVVAIGVVTGPLLLIGLLAVIIKRRFWPDVI